MANNINATKEQERPELYRTIWHELRTAIDEIVANIEGKS
jgi:hypothetical protein